MVCFASLISPENIDYLKNTYINSKENLFALQTPQKLKKAQLRLVFFMLRRLEHFSLYLIHVLKSTYEWQIKHCVLLK